MVHVPIDFTDEVRSSIDAHRRLKRLLQEVSQLSLAASSHPCSGAETEKGPVVGLGEALPTTILHFWPEFNRWLDEVPDTRFLPLVIYDKRFLIWWGISLYLFQLGSRRQLDFSFDRRGTEVLNNLNRLAQTQQVDAPGTRHSRSFPGTYGCHTVCCVATRLHCCLIRMRCLDTARLQGRLVVALDATGHLAFRRPHCPNPPSTVTKLTPPICIKCWKPNCLGQQV